MVGMLPVETGHKVHYAGTHRVRRPSDTLAWIKPLLPLFGITRLADVTWLDEIGIPVYQAVRPNALLLSVSQGKGVTRELARVSAAMEAIELWHAEHLAPGPIIATVGDIADGLDYNLPELGLARRHFLNPSTRLEWTSATRLDTYGSTLVPAAYLRLDGRVLPRWTPPLFQASTNGLASGNVRNEAILHGLCEVVERDAIVRAHQPGAVRHAVDLTTVGGTSAQLLEHFHRSGTRVDAELLPHPVGVPVFSARLRSDLFAVTFDGYGCHPDPDVALSRALSEAAQSRVTAIAGTRDDVSKSVYRQSRPFGASHGSAARPAACESGHMERWAFQDVPTLATADLDCDLAQLVSRVVAVTERPPLVVDLTRAEFGIPVVRVVVPGQRCPEEF